MIDDLEPIPDPNVARRPVSRKPAEPVRVPHVLRSYTQDQAFAIRRATEPEALAVKAEITAAVRWLNRWGLDTPDGHVDYDIRVRPYISRHWEDQRGEHLVDPEHPAPRGATVYFKTNFHVHDPLPRGFRGMSRDRLDAAHQNSAQTRGVHLAGKHRRTVQENG